MKLYLTGGGEQNDFYQLDKHFIQGLPDEASILVIPVASEPEDHEDVLERIEECFHHKKVSRIIMKSEIDQITEEELDGFDVVFIEGGNTFRLVQAVRNSSFFNLLEKFLQNGHTIYADSAGAIILGSSVKTAFLGDEADDDDHKLQDYRGLSLLGSWALHCHYDHDDHDQMQDLMYDTGTPLLALAEPCGIYIENGEVTVLGKDPLEVFTFSGRQVFETGQSFNLEKILEG